MLKNYRQHFFGVKVGENNAVSHVLFERGRYARNVSGRAKLHDSTVLLALK